MKPVKQIDPDGCGFACIAILAGVKYNDVWKVAVDSHGFDPTGSFGTGTGQLRRLANHFGVTIEVKRMKKFKGWDELPDAAILRILGKEYGRGGHWVVFKRGLQGPVIYDPFRSSRDLRRWDFPALKVKGYLPVGIE